MLNYIVEFKIGTETFSTGNLNILPRIGEKIRYNYDGGKVILQIEDIIYEFIPGGHKSMRVTVQCKLLEKGEY